MAYQPCFLLQKFGYDDFAKSGKGSIYEAKKTVIEISIKRRSYWQNKSKDVSKR